MENHGRYHTIVITKKHARNATPGSACDCAIAHAVSELPEVYAAVILRRKSYLLEKDARGRLKIYRYNSPDQARRLTVRFDRRLSTGERVEATLRPPAPSESLAKQRHYQRRHARRLKRGDAPSRPGPRFTAFSFTRTLIPDRMLQPLD